MPQRKKIPGLPSWDPWKPVDWTNQDAAAIQALQRGAASPDQQRHALQFIVNSLAATYDDPFRPGVDGARSTDYACGRRYVGLQIVKLANLNLSAFKKEPSEQP